MRKLKKHKLVGLLAGIVLISFLSGFTDEEEVLALRGGRIITVTQGTIEKGTVLIKAGKIAAVGQDVVIPREAKVIDAANCTILPGLIDSFTNLGTTEVEPTDRDFDEATSPVTPHLRIIDALNPENSFVPVARCSGVTAALTAPGEGNLLSGQSALICLSGDTAEEMVLKSPAAVHANLGEIPKLRYQAKDQLPSTRMGAAALLRQTLIEAQEYENQILAFEKKLEEYKSRIKEEKEGKEENKGKEDKEPLSEPSPPPKDFKLEALIPVLKGEMPLIVRANRLDDILTALRIADEFRLKIILNHGAEAYKVADELAARKIPVLVGPLAEYYQRIETRGALFENVVRLHKAGIKLAFQTGSIANVSDLLYQAEMAVRYGLSDEEAFKMLTLYPAQIFGVDGMIGSLEKGKLANLVVFEGDPLKRPSRVKMVVIKGQVFETKLD